MTPVFRGLLLSGSLRYAQICLHRALHSLYGGGIYGVYLIRALTLRVFRLGEAMQANAVPEGMSTLTSFAMNNWWVFGSVLAVIAIVSIWHGYRRPSSFVAALLGGACLMGFVLWAAAFCCCYTWL